MKQKHIVTKQLSFLIAMILVCLQLLPIGPSQLDKHSLRKK